MAKKVFFLAALVVVVSAEILPTYKPPHPHPTYKAPYPHRTYDDHDYGYPNYFFIWEVNDEYSNNHYGHEETREGYDTEGSYFVVLPDGRVQEVKYKVIDDSGFLADVSFKGDAHYPTYPSEQAHKPHSTYKPTPTYKPHPTYKSPHD